MKKTGLYTILAVACLLGYLWLGYSAWSEKSNRLPGINSCFIKMVTGIPCPSCGTTRAVRLMFQGDWKAALLMNPMGVFVAIALIVIPFWLVFDGITGKQTLFRCYKKAEENIRLKWFGLVLFFLIVVNWIWNIYKEV